MLFLAEQHLVAAKLVRKNGATRAGADLEKFIKMSNSFVVCARLAAKSRGGINLDRFDWKPLRARIYKVPPQAALMRLGST